MRIRHCSIHVFRTPLSPFGLFFLGMPAWTLESEGWIQNFTNQSLQGAIHFVAFTHVESWSYVYIYSVYRWNLSLRKWYRLWMEKYRTNHNFRCIKYICTCSGRNDWDACHYDTGSKFMVGGGATEEKLP